MGFEVKDSGERQEFSSGFVRDSEEGKLDYTLIFDGPMADRLAAHLTKGGNKYGPRNWALACTNTEARRFRRSAGRHFRQWLRGEQDEDHAAAAAFNMFAHEYVLGILRRDPACLEFLAVARQDEAEKFGYGSWTEMDIARRERNFVDAVMGTA